MSKKAKKARPVAVAATAPVYVVKRLPNPKPAKVTICKIAACPHLLPDEKALYLGEAV